jgi:hypothetical protein
VIEGIFYCKLPNANIKPRRVPEMVESCPQLKHLANQFVESCAKRNFVRQGTAMSEFRDRYFDAHPRSKRIGQAGHIIRDARFKTADDLRDSSPWPWIYSLAISLAMWASLAWLIWGR